MPRARSAPATDRWFADLSHWWKTAISGADARRWLGDLLTADVVRIAPGSSARALLLGPTGRIRADVTVAATEGVLLLLQDPAQPRPVGDLLRPYLLSADVRLEDRTAAFGVVAFPSGAAPELPEAIPFAPSCLGPGVDLVVEGSSEPIRLAAEANGWRAAAPDEVEAWRVLRGAPRFPVDLTESSLPHEAGLDRLVDPEKGCFLGQEAVAKVRNLGHPPWVVLAGHAPASIAAGALVLAGAREVGAVTSATPTDGGSAVIARVRWEARDDDLRIDGASLERRPAADDR